MPTTPQGHRAPIRYELRVLGHLDPHWTTWFTGLTLTQDDDGTTSLCGVVTDQAELHGLIAKIRDLGVTLLSVIPADPAGEQQPHTKISKTTSRSLTAAVPSAKPKPTPGDQS